MQRTDALDDLANQWGFGRIREALADMPMRQGRQAQLEGVAGQRGSVIDQVAHDGIAGRRQKSAPGDFERSSACWYLRRVLARGAGLLVLLNVLAHQRAPLFVPVDNRDMVKMPFHLGSFVIIGCENKVNHGFTPSLNST